MRENCPVVPNTPTSSAKLIVELRKLWKELKVESFLQGCIVTTDASKKEYKNFDRILLKLNAKERELEIKVYRKNELLNATQDLAAAEKESSEKAEIDAVLVEVDSLTKLRIAYPNYFSDTNDFVNVVAEEIGEGIWIPKQEMI
jgi:hypothetical protein